jgi:ribosomal protein L11 methyltransferase
MVGRVWHRVEITVDRVACEAVEYALMEAGANGTETINDVLSKNEDGAMRVIAYFDSLPDEATIRASIDDALRIYSLPATSLLTPLSFDETPARDWLAEWKRSWQAVEVGRFIIAPPWSEVKNANDRFVIRIEPGMAFGTGTHETTRLCLAAIENYFTEGQSFLDVGTGTGILAIAAAMMNPKARIEGCDTDAEAIEIARENARFNGVESRISFRAGTVDVTTRSADCVCANLTADVIVNLLPALLGATCERLILSGILTTQIEMVRARLAELGTSECETMTDGEWAAIIV